MKQLVIFERCKYAPTKDDPAYREFKEQLKADAIRFINDFIDVYPFVGEKIFVCRSDRVILVCAWSHRRLQRFAL